MISCWLSGLGCIFVLKEEREGRGCGQAALWRTALFSAQKVMKEEVFPVKKRDLKELQASWAVKEAPGSKQGMLELCEEGNLRLTQAKAVS